MKRLRCRSCTFLDWNAFGGRYEKTDHHFCGLHGRVAIPDPDGEQLHLDNNGSCGYWPKERHEQLTIPFEDPKDAMERYYELTNFEGKKYLAELPDDTNEIAGVIVSGDEVLVYPFFYDPEGINREDDYLEGYFHKVFKDGKWEDKR